jgi:hypothetical protein
MDVVSDIRSMLPKIKRRFSIDRIGVFGSYRSGEQREESDIDILVELEEISFDNYMGLLLFLYVRF